MVNSKKMKKAKQPLVVRVIKIIAVVLCSAILLAAIAERVIHYYKHITK